MHGAAIGTAIASNGAKQYSNNMAVTKCADERPTWERSYSDVCHKVTCNTSESSWSRSPVTVKSPWPAVQRNMSPFNVVHGWFVASFGRQGAAVGLLGDFIR